MSVKNIALCCAAVSLSGILQSFTSLAAIGLEDGEEATTYESQHVNVTCLVTSSPGGAAISAGKSG